MPDKQNKSKPPIVQASPRVLPEAELHHLNNGIPVYLLNSGSEELMKLEFIFRAGQTAENIPLLSSTANMMLVEGTERYSAHKINELLDYYGSFFNNFSEKDDAGISIMFINRHLEKIAALCHEILFNPVFPGDELKALIDKRLQWFILNHEKVNVVASDHFFSSIFGPGHPYGTMIKISDFRKINRSQLISFHKDYYTSRNLTIIASGKIPGNAVDVLNSHFGRSDRGNEKKVHRPGKPCGKKSRKVFVEKADAVQSAIRIGSQTVSKRHPDYHGLKVVNTILGGYFGSRLMKNIREDKGYTYGIGSSVVSYDLSAYKVIGTEVGIKYTTRTIEEIYKEIYDLQRQPVIKGELEIVRNFMLGEMVRMFDGPFSVAECFKGVWEFGLDYSYYYRLADKIKTIEQDEIMSLAQTYYNIDDLYEIIVGRL